MLPVENVQYFLLYLYKTVSYILHPEFLFDFKSLALGY